MRRIAEQVVRAHDERSLTGVVAPVPDPHGVVGELVARVAGFGPLQRFLDDPEVEEIWINDPSRVFVARNGRHELTNVILTRAEVQELVERMLKSSGRRIDLSPAVRRRDAPGGAPAARGARGHQPRLRGGQHPQVRPQGRAARATSSGSARCRPAPRGSSRRRCWPGRTSWSPEGPRRARPRCSNCLAAAIPGGDRIVSAEEVFELRFSHPDWVAMQTRQAGLEGTGEVSLRDLVRETLRMRPTRVIVGEVRAAECLDLLLALNAGLPGMATLHANSAREALVKLCTLPLLAGENISARFVVPTVASSVDLVVHLGLDHARRTTRQRDRRGPGPGRARHRRDRAGLRPARAATSSTPAGCRPGWSPSSGSGVDVHRLLREAD